MIVMDFDSSATTLHALNSSTNQLGTLNLTTGAFTSTVAWPAPAGASWTDRLNANLESVVKG